MNYNASVSDFFKCPKWGTNLMLGAVAILIPFVGQLVLAGWHVTSFWARGDDEDPATFPPFDFRFFGKMLASMLFMFGLGLCAMIVTILTCYIGMFFVMPLVIFSWHHLQKQIYQLHLRRGGQVVPLSPKLNDSPPRLPGAW